VLSEAQQAAVGGVAVAETHKRNKESFFVHRLNGYGMKSNFDGTDIDLSRSPPKLPVELQSGGQGGHEAKPKPCREQAR